MNAYNANEMQLQWESLVKLGAAPLRIEPRGKASIEKGWSSAPKRTLAQFILDLKPGENVGIRLGAPSDTPFGYLHCIDFDLRDPAKAGEANAALDAVLPQHARAFVVNTGSGTGQHLFFFTPEPLDSQTIAKGDGWEVALKGTGTYVVGPGSIHPSGGRYTWADSKRLDSDLLNLIPPPQIDLAPLRKDTTRRDPLDDLLGGNFAPVDWTRLRSALEFVDGHDDRDIWLSVGAALHHESGGKDDGYQLWCQWSENSHKFNSRDQRRTWASFGKSRGAPITAGTIFQMAKEAGWWPGFDVRDSDFDDLPELDLLGLTTGKSEESKLRFIRPAECTTAPKRGYIIKGLLAPRDVAAIVGAPGCGKSTLAPLLGYMVAQGKETFGQRTRQGGVFYVAAEDETGLQMRVAALREEHGEGDGFQVVAGVADLLRRESPDLAALTAAVKEQRPSLIFIDTLAMAFPGLEENDAGAMGRVVAVARSLTRWGAAVVLIHHDTKAGDGLPRGHSILNGALDVSLSLTRNGKSVVGKLSKNRNGPCDLQIHFEIEGIELGEDDDGDLITAAFCKPIDDLFGDLGPRNEKEHIFLDAMYSILERDGGTEVQEKLLKIELKRFPALSRSESADSQRKAFRRVRDALTGHGVLSRDPEQESLKPLITLDTMRDCLRTGQAGQERDKAVCPGGPKTGQTGQTP